MGAEKHVGFVFGISYFCQIFSQNCNVPTIFIEPLSDKFSCKSISNSLILSFGQRDKYDVMAEVTSTLYNFGCHAT
jgi:hypothetical protein